MHGYVMSRGRRSEEPMSCTIKLTIKHLLIKYRKDGSVSLKYNLPRNICLSY